MNLKCFFKHDWKINKVAKASDIIFLLKKQKGILKKSSFVLEQDYQLVDRICKRCGKKDNEILEAKKILEEKLIEKLKRK